MPREKQCKRMLPVKPYKTMAAWTLAVFWPVSIGNPSGNSASLRGGGAKAPAGMFLALDEVPHGGARWQAITSGDFFTGLRTEAEEALLQPSMRLYPDACRLLAKFVKKLIAALDSIPSRSSRM